jgi:hypothetical protein
MAAEEAFDEVEAINGYFDQDIYDKYHDTYFTVEQLNKWMIFDHTTLYLAFFLISFICWLS